LGKIYLSYVICTHVYFVNRQKGEIMLLNNFFDLSIGKTTLNFIIIILFEFCVGIKIHNRLVHNNQCK
jgi:hypothetical protein